MHTNETPEEGETVKNNNLESPPNPTTSQTTTDQQNGETSVAGSSEMEDIDLNDEVAQGTPQNSSSSPSNESPKNSKSIAQLSRQDNYSEQSTGTDMQEKPTDLEKEAKELKKKELLRDRLTIPISLLELAPSPDLIEIFGRFHAQAIEMIIEKDIEPHTSLNGEWRIFRFLTGYNFNITNALAAFQKHLVWLKSVYGDSTIRNYILSEMLPRKSPEHAPFHDKILEQFPLNMLLRDDTGELLFDNNGNIISIERPGFIDSKRFSGSISDTELFLWYNYQLEFRSILLDRLSRDRDSLVQSTQIIDLSGISSRSLARMASHLWKKSIVLASENYPEMLANIYFINTPKIFNTIWSMFKPLLNDRTINKIHILNENFEEVLSSHINADSLPTFLGGKRTNSLANVPFTGMLSHDRYGLGFGRTELILPPRKKEHLSYKVAAGMSVRWAWALENYDINFYIKIAKHRSSTLFEKQETETILSSKSYDCSRTFRGTVYSPYDATIIFTWDNSWGLISSRHIHYRIVVLSPEDEE